MDPIANILQYLIDRREIDVVQLAAEGGCTDATIYNWLKEIGEPRADVLRKWFASSAINQRVKDVMLSHLTGGQASFPESTTEPDLDLNNDDVINMVDAVGWAILSCKSTQNILETVHQSFIRDPDSVSTNEILAVEAYIATAIKNLNATKQICTREVSKRKKARQPLEAV